MRRGFVGFESVLGLVFALMLGATVFSVYHFMTGQPKATSNSDLMTTYHGVFERLRADFRSAVTAERRPDTLKLTDPRQQVVTWSLSDGTLTRTAPDGTVQKVLTGLHSGGFDLSVPDRQLVSIWLIPADSFAPPFFTSFALRGGKR